MDNKSKFKTLIIIDLETTGLIIDRPKITELAMTAVNIATLEQTKPDDELPRVLNKFVKFFNPLKSIPKEVVQLTSLNNCLLNDYVPFNKETVTAMEAFLSDFQKPMCFVAHNGNEFDFPILFEEIRCALSNYNSNESSHEMDASTSSDTNPDTLLPTNGSSIQIPTDNNNLQTSLLSIDCADSLVFFRQMHALLNEMNDIQYTIDKISTEASIIANANGCNNNAVIHPMGLSSSPGKSLNYNNNNSSYIESLNIPIKYIPSPDPARQQPSMKLVKIYEREFKQKISHLKSHRAEDDCLMLLAILKRHLNNWLQWIEINHQPLSNFVSLSCTTTRNSPK